MLKSSGASTFLPHLFVAFFHGSLARQFHPAFVVNADALDPDFVADLDDVLGLFDAEVGQFADVHETVLAREDFDEASEFFDRDDLSAIDFAHFDFRGHALDGFAGNLHALGGDGVNLHRTVIFDVNLAARLINDAFDILAAGTDQLANSLRIDLQRDDAWRVFAQLRPRRRERVR